MTSELGYARIAAMTLRKCEQDCRDTRLYRCCDPYYCEIAERYARRRGVRLRRTENKPVPFLGPDGRCTVPPHLRPICSVHHCDILSLGCFRNDPKTTMAYFRLRDRLGAEVDLDEAYAEDR